MFAVTRAPEKGQMANVVRDAGMGGSHPAIVETSSQSSDTTGPQGRKRCP